MLSYRTYFKVGDERASVIPVLLAQCHSWMADKGYEPARLRFGESVQLAETAEVTLLQVLDEDAEALRFRFVERSARGKWVVQLTAQVPVSGELPWVLIDVESPDSGPASTPKLARRIVDHVVALDGNFALTNGAGHTSVEGVDELVQAILDPDRRNLIFVAGTGTADISREDWGLHITKLVRGADSLATTRVLDPEATERFAMLMGNHHRVAPWNMRSYYPKVELHDRLDALRHRNLSTARIASGDERQLSRMLGARAREVAQQAPLPLAAVALDRRFRHELDRLLLAQLVEDRVEPRVDEHAEPDTSVGAVTLAPVDDDVDLEDQVVEAEPTEVEIAAVVAEGEAVTALAALLADALGTVEITPESLEALGRLVRKGRTDERSRLDVQERVAELQEAVEVLETERDELRLALDDERLERVIAAEDATHAEELVSVLKVELGKLGHGELAWTVAPTHERLFRPESFDELLSELGRFDKVEFTGDAAKALALDEQDPVGVWARKTWDALAALQDYVEQSVAGNCDRSVHGYLENTPAGCRTFAANRHAHDESEVTKSNPKYSQVRFLPVPTVIDPAGRVFMGAHFKIAKSGRTSPRMHYHDASAAAGLVYVGYIGAHLPTQS